MVSQPNPLPTVSIGVPGLVGRRSWTDASSEPGWATRLACRLLLLLRASQVGSSLMYVAVGVCRWFRLKNLSGTAASARGCSNDAGAGVIPATQLQVVQVSRRNLFLVFWDESPAPPLAQ